jgi:DNA polymerase-3 subunit alpha
MAFVTLDDRTARMEIRIFSRVFEQYRALLANDKVLVVQGTLGFDDFSGSMRLNANRIFDIDQAREVYARRLVVSVGARIAGNGFVKSLAAVLTPYCEGSCPVGIQYQNGSAQAHITLGEEWRVHPTDELLHRLRELAGEAQVTVVYG